MTSPIMALALIRTEGRALCSGSTVKICVAVPMHPVRGDVCVAISAPDDVAMRRLMHRHCASEGSAPSAPRGSSPSCISPAWY